MHSLAEKLINLIEEDDVASSDAISATASPALFATPNIPSLALNIPAPMFGAWLGEDMIQYPYPCYIDQPNVQRQPCHPWLRGCVLSKITELSLSLDG